MTRLCCPAAFVVLVLALAAEDCAAAPAPAATQLLPLTQGDEERSQESGCNFSFGDARKDYVQLIGNGLTIRTRSGLHTCHITDADAGAFMATKGAAAICDGLRLKIFQTGRITQDPASDSSSGPARLVIEQGKTSHTLSGHWGVAC